MTDAIAAVEDAFASVVDGTALQPPRVVSEDGTTLAMMAGRSSNGAPYGTSFKLVSVWEPNRLRNLPALHALAVWLDPETRHPHLLIEGAALTALRTGAATGVATQLLASPAASTLAVIGAGGQAADQIRGVCAVRPIKEVRIVSRSASANRLVENLAPELEPVSLRAAASIFDAVDGADIICCATNSRSPVIPSGAVARRVHINAIGSYRPDMHEVPGELLARAEIVAVDSLAAALAEAGEVISAIEERQLARAEIVEIGALLVDPPSTPTQLTVFKSVGIAMQDWAICRLLSERLRPDTPHVDLLTPACAAARRESRSRAQGPCC